MKRMSYFLLLITLSLTSLSAWSNSYKSLDQYINQEVRALLPKARDLNPNVLRLALKAYVHARQRGLDNRQILTVIDYSKSSAQRRMWVFDLRNHQVPFYTWVAHGKNSGGDRPTHFSNSPGSKTSSVGVFLTGNTYYGHKGYSLTLDGLERGINNYARSRAIVIHGAWYVNPNFIQATGRTGASWGCPAISENLARPVINTIKNGTIVFAYYPERQWLNHSAFLT